MDPVLWTCWVLHQERTEDPSARAGQCALQPGAPTSHVWGLQGISQPALSGSRFLALSLEPINQSTRNCDSSKQWLLWLYKVSHAARTKAQNTTPAGKAPCVQPRPGRQAPREKRASPRPRKMLRFAPGPHHGSTTTWNPEVLTHPFPESPGGTWQAQVTSVTNSWLLGTFPGLEWARPGRPSVLRSEVTGAWVKEGRWEGARSTHVSHLLERPHGCFVMARPREPASANLCFLWNLSITEGGASETEPP